MLLVGPRAAGKTTTAAQYAATIIRLDREAEAAALDGYGHLGFLRHVAVPLANELPDVSPRPGCVDGVDLEARTLHVSGCAPEDEEMHWDRLVLTPGSVTKLFGVPGVAEHARGLKTVAEALYLREQFLYQLELAEHESDPEVRQARRTVEEAEAMVAAAEKAKAEKPRKKKA